MRTKGCEEYLKLANRSKENVKNSVIYIHQILIPCSNVEGSDGQDRPY
jgi:hypothetical protein